jgi:hypothetical protein
MNELIEKINQSKKNNEVLVIKNFNNEIPTWNNFINNINYKFHNFENDSVLPNNFFLKNKGFQTEIIQYNTLDLVTNYSIKVKENEISKNYFPEINNIIELIKKIKLKNNEFYCKAITNFIGNDQEYYIHCDQTDVINLHCIGKVEWRIYKNYVEKYDYPVTKSDIEYFSIFLEPGDFVFMPSKTFHQVVVTEPRASLLFDFFMEY